MNGWMDGSVGTNVQYMHAIWLLKQVDCKAKAIEIATFIVFCSISQDFFCTALMRLGSWRGLLGLADLA